ncbi:hypothetical protein ACLOAV_003515 [Pseudogymnoascus australis]
MVGSRGPAGAQVSKTTAGEAAKKSDELPLFRNSQDIVYVAVGPEGKWFGMHKDHLVNTSPYMKAAFMGKFQEASMGVVTLKETSVETFGMFNEWLYTGVITSKYCVEKGLSIPDLLARDKPTFSELLDVWLLADYLLVPQLKNFIADYMVAKHKRRHAIPRQDFNYFYKNTQAGSPMRKLMVDICVWRFSGVSEGYRTSFDLIPREMAVDLLVALTRRIEGLDRDPFTLGSAAYVHYHVPLEA